MSGATAMQQRGMTFSNFLLVAILLAFVAVLGMKIIPAYVEDRTIRSILDAIAHDPDMQNAQPNDIYASWEKRALINNITIIDPSTIVVQKTPGSTMVLSVKYNVKIGLVGNASLLLEFDTSSTRTR